MPWFCSRGRHDPIYTGCMSTLSHGGCTISIFYDCKKSNQTNKLKCPFLQRQTVCFLSRITAIQLSFKRNSRTNEQLLLVKHKNVTDEWKITLNRVCFTHYWNAPISLSSTEYSCMNLLCFMVTTHCLFRGTIYEHFEIARPVIYTSASLCFFPHRCQRRPDCVAFGISICYKCYAFGFDIQFSIQPKPMLASPQSVFPK